MARKILLLLLSVVLVGGALIYQKVSKSTVYRYFPDGSVEYEERLDPIKFVMGKREGSVKTFYPNGQLKEEFSIVEGRRQGKYKSFYEDGRLRSEEDFHNNMLHGMAYRYRPDGKFFAVHTFENHKYNGLNKWYYENGNMRSEEYYKDGMQHGLGKFYWENGNLKEETDFVNNTGHGISKRYREDGTLEAIRELKEGKLTGFITFFNEKGIKKSKIQHLDSVRHGEAIWYYPDGTVKESAEYQNGDLHGVRKHYYENGKLLETKEYVNDKLIGRHRLYYENGQLDLEKNYDEDGLRSGETKQYFENGQLEYSIGFRKGQSHGEYIRYDETGRLLWKLEMADGLIVKPNQDSLFTEAELAASLLQMRVGPFEERIRILFGSGQFAEIERLAQVFRSPESRLEWGGRTLSSFYSGLSDGFGKIGSKHWDLYFAKLDEWRAEFPDSVVERITRAEALAGQAWKYRGGGYSNTVSDQSARQFKQKMTEAQSELQAARQLKAQDPHLYAVWLDVALSLGDSPRKRRQIFDEGVAIEPGYSPLYEEMARGLTRRWGGRRGVLERFMSEVTRQLDESIRTEVLAPTYYSIQSFLKDDLFKKYRFSSPEIKSSYESYIKKYPKAYGIMHAYAWYCVRTDDHERASKIFLQESLSENYRSTFWKERKVFNEYKKWALSDDPEPEKYGLHKAVARNDYLSVSNYIDASVDLDESNYDGQTPLEIALRNYDNLMAQNLINAGADISKKGSGYDYPIHTAARRKLNDVLELILDKQPGQNLWGGQYENLPIHYAAEVGSLSVIKKMVDLNPEIINLVNTGNQTALHYACRSGQYKVVEFLLTQTELEHATQDTWGYNAMHRAAEKGDLKSVQLLHETGHPYISQKNQRDQTPLDIARGRKHDDIVTYLESQMVEGPVTP